jgi:hypothetical protein
MYLRACSRGRPRPSAAKAESVAAPESLTSLSSLFRLCRHPGQATIQLPTPIRVLHRAVQALLVIVAATLATYSAGQAQNPAPRPAAPPVDTLRLYLDCPDFPCDYDFFRTEIDFVNHVRERQDADVYVLLTTRHTGAEGTEFTLSFIGQKDFQGVDDKLQYTSGPAESADAVRRALAQVLKRGLVRYVNHTSLADRVEITSQPSAGGLTRAAGPDPWNYWAFRTMLNGLFDGEEAFRSTSVSLSLGANRTTENWKINSSVQARYSESKFDIGGGQMVTTIQRNYGFDGLVVKSLGSRWSVGARGTITSSTFLNQELTLRLAPAIEYNFFPYSESTRWQFTLQYSLGADAFDYHEETIFGKTAETLFDERLLGSLRITQPWGSITTSLEGSHYLHDFSKQRGIIVSNIDLNVFKGFSLVLLGSVQLVRDQIYLPKGGISEEDILLRQRALATSFTYTGSIGFSYTFGSSSSIVNPRFSGSSGGTSIIN